MSCTLLTQQGIATTTCIILTVIGKDHPGIVAALSEVVANHDGNWTESSMSTLVGQIACILLATVLSGNAVAAYRKYRARILGNWKVRPPE